MFQYYPRENQSLIETPFISIAQFEGEDVVKNIYSSHTPELKSN